VTTTDPYAHLRADLTGMPPLEAMGAAIHEPAADRRPYEQPYAPPQRVVYVPDPHVPGTMMPVNADQYRAAQAAAAAAAETGTPNPGPAPQHDVWPLRMAVGGGATSVVIGTIALAGPHLAEAGHAAEMTGIGIAGASLGIGILVMLFKGATGPKQPVNVNVSVTTNSRVTANASSRSHHRSR
jgi:hypothetical protein